MGRLLRIVVIVLGVLLFGSASLYMYADSSLNNAFKKEYPLPELSISSDVATANLALGERIVRVRNGCAECHGEDLSGKPVIDVPAIGKIYSSNLTPFALGSKSDEDIALAIRHGLKTDGTTLVFMPSYEYQNLSKSDLAATIAYLKTVPPVEKQNTPVEIGPIGKMLYLFGQLPVLTPAAMVNHQADFVTKPLEAPTREFGEYLVKSACIGCHGNELRGGPIPGGAPDWPPAADIRFKDRDNWSQTTFFNTLKTGISATSGKELRLPMIKLVGTLNDKELTAIWLYLSSLEQTE